MWPKSEGDQQDEDTGCVLATSGRQISQQLIGLVVKGRIAWTNQQDKWCYLPRQRIPEEEKAYCLSICAGGVGVGGEIINSNMAHTFCDHQRGSSVTGLSIGAMREV